MRVAVEVEKGGPASETHPGFWVCAVRVVRHDDGLAEPFQATVNTVRYKGWRGADESTIGKRKDWILRQMIEGAYNLSWMRKVCRCSVKLRWMRACVRAIEKTCAVGCEN